MKWNATLLSLNARKQILPLVLHSSALCKTWRITGAKFMLQQAMQVTGAKFSLQSCICYDILLNNALSLGYITPALQQWNLLEHLPPQQRVEQSWDMWLLPCAGDKCSLGDLLLPGPWLGNFPQSSSVLYSHGYMLPFSLQEDFKGQRHLMKFLPSRPLGSEAHYIKMPLVPS